MGSFLTHKLVTINIANIFLTLENVFISTGVGPHSELVMFQCNVSTVAQNGQTKSCSRASLWCFSYKRLSFQLRSGG